VAGAVELHEQERPLARCAMHAARMLSALALQCQMTAERGRENYSSARAVCFSDLAES